MELGSLHPENRAQDDMLKHLFCGNDKPHF